MKKFLFLVLFLSSCAHSHSIANPATKLSYRCTLESEMCFLVDCGAKLATEEGYPTYRDDKEGELVFVPGEIRTVFFGTEVPTVGHFPLVSPSLVPGRIPVVERHGLQVVVNGRRGGVEVRDADYVGMFADYMELGRR